jgi:hypothetical protein
LHHEQKKLKSETPIGLVVLVVVAHEVRQVHPEMIRCDSLYLD